MSFTYWLPDETGKKVDFTTDVSSIIIIGANGSGKSKLGAWIEQQNYSGEIQEANSNAISVCA